MTQSRKHSLIEACFNTAFGFCVAVFSQWAVFPFFGIHVPIEANVKIAGVFTVISVGRQYCVRRFFNRFQIVVVTDE